VHIFVLWTADISFPTATKTAEVTTH